MDEENSGEEREEKKEEIVSEPRENAEKPEEPAKPVMKTDADMPKRSENMTDKFRKNPFILSTLVCGALAILLLVVMVSGGSITGNVVSKQRAGNNLVEYLNTIVDTEVKLVGVEDDGALYEVTIDYDGQEIPIYVTKDGASYTSNLKSLSAPPINTPSQQTSTEPSEEFSETDLEEIRTFSECLAEKGMKVYGAAWCPHCQNLIASFGGKELIAPIYIECSDSERNPTENAELCEQEDIQGFPTIKVNGEIYEDSRTFEGFAEATGCIAPNISSE